MMDSLIIRKATKHNLTEFGELFKEMFDFHKELDLHFTRTETGHQLFAKWFIDQI